MRAAEALAQVPFDTVRIMHNLTYDRFLIHLLRANTAFTSSCPFPPRLYQTLGRISLNEWRVRILLHSRSLSLVARVLC